MFLRKVIKDEKLTNVTRRVRQNRMKTGQQRSAKAMLSLQLSQSK